MGVTRGATARIVGLATLAAALVGATGCYDAFVPATPVADTVPVTSKAPDSAVATTSTPDVTDATDVVDATETETSDTGEVVVPPTCETTRPTECPDPPPTYATSIAPIVEARCLGCHDGEDPDGPWALDTWGHMSDWTDTVRSSMLDCSMPPPEENIPMTTEERMTILYWIRCGLPL